MSGSTQSGQGEVEDIDAKAILVAVDERRRWQQRRTDLVIELQALPYRQRRLRVSDLHRIDRTLTYYDALIRDMKRKVQKGTSVNAFFERLSPSQ